MKFKLFLFLNINLYTFIYINFQYNYYIIKIDMKFIVIINIIHSNRFCAHIFKVIFGIAANPENQEF